MAVYGMARAAGDRHDAGHGGDDLAKAATMVNTTLASGHCATHAS
jgi:hypothetical protein